MHFLAKFLSSPGYARVMYYPKILPILSYAGNINVYRSRISSTCIPASLSSECDYAIGIIS